MAGSLNAQLLFEKWDANNDGRLNHAEIKSNLHAAGYEYGDWSHLWQNYDRDASGFIELEEFVRMYSDNFNISADDARKKLE